MTQTCTAAIALTEVLGVLKTEGVMERVVRIDVTSDRVNVEMRPARAAGKPEIEGEENERITVSRRQELKDSLPGAVFPRDLR